MLIDDAAVWEVKTIETMVNSGRNVDVRARRVGIDTRRGVEAGGIMPFGMRWEWGL